VNAARLRIVDADFEEIGDQRRADRRRSSDRRAPRLKLDPAFAATLINHITPAERTRGGYVPGKGPRAGIAFDLSA
jgi:hypothetical protein